MKKIAILGCGISGITSAYWLAKAGHKVVVFDKERYPAMMTSYANGSQLSVCNAPVWTNWGTVLKATKWLMKKDAPFYIGAKPELQKIQWLAGFMSATIQGKYKENTIKTIELGLDARQALEEIIQTEEIEFDHVKKGILHIYTNRHSLRHAQKQGKLITSGGCEWEPVSYQECCRLEPSLANLDHKITGGIYTASDSTGDMNIFINSLKAILQNKYGVMFYLDTELHSEDILLQDKGVEIAGTHYDDLIISGGVASRDFAKKFGDNLNIYPIKGYSITVDLDEKSQQHAPWVSLLDDDAKIVCSRLGANRLRVAGTAELVGRNLDIEQHRVKPLLNWVKDFFPGVSTQYYRPWAGLRPMTCNMMPIVRESTKTPGIWYHTGHGHLGWTLSAGTARTLANLIASKS